MCWNWSLDFLLHHLCSCFSSKSFSWLTWQNFNPVIPRLLVAAVLVHWIRALIEAICASFLVPFWDTDSKHKGWSVSNAMSIVNGMGNMDHFKSILQVRRKKIKKGSLISSDDKASALQCRVMGLYFFWCPEVLIKSSFGNLQKIGDNKLLCVKNISDYHK